MQFTSLTKALLPAALLAATLTGCGTDEPNNTPNTPVVEQKGTFVIPADVAASGNAASHILLTTANLSGGTLSPRDNGLLFDGGFEYIFFQNKYLCTLQYNQANAGTTRSYVLRNGQLEKRDKGFEVRRFTTYGTWDDELMTVSTGDSPKEFADSHGYLPKTFLVSYLNIPAETERNNDSKLPQFRSENFLGNGEFVTLSGLLQREGKLYSAVIPMGLSQYGSSVDGGKYIRPGFADLVKTENGGRQSSAYKKGELQWTQYPDECWLAIFDNNNFEGRKLIKTDKISYACGRFKSQYFQMIWNDADGDLYVFSPSFAKTMSDKRQQTTLPAGVVRVKKGAADFDPNYYFNLETLTSGRAFQRTFPVGGDQFLFYLYDKSYDKLSNQDLANQLGVFSAKSGKFVSVSGLPSDVVSLGNRPYAENGFAYVPVKTKTGNPAIYKINLSTGVATRGVEVEATQLNAVGRLLPL